MASKYIRKTRDEWEIQTYTGAQYGWELATTEESRRNAVAQLKCYRENEPELQHRIKKKRVPLLDTLYAAYGYTSGAEPTHINLYDNEQGTELRLTLELSDVRTPERADTTIVLANVTYILVWID